MREPTEMELRVAEAIGRATYSECNVTPEDGHWRTFLPEARAAIRAMREATDGMVEAGYKIPEEDGIAQVPEIWEAMIDAASPEVK